MYSTIAAAVGFSRRRVHRMSKPVGALLGDGGHVVKEHCQVRPLLSLVVVAESLTGLTVDRKVVHVLPLCAAQYHLLGREDRRLCFGLSRAQMGNETRHEFVHVVVPLQKGRHEARGQVELDHRRPAPKSQVQS